MTRRRPARAAAHRCARRCCPTSTGRPGPRRSSPPRWTGCAGGGPAPAARPPPPPPAARARPASRPRPRRPPPRGTGDQALRATAVGQRALDQLSSAEQAAAAVPVRGPGLLVTVADAEPDAGSDPVGGATETDPDGLVRDSDLQLVVNALWAAGAEAVSVNGQRLGPTSAIRTAGEAVLVDFDPVTSPYEVSAVGNAATLRDAFLASPEVGALAVIAESYGLRFEFAKENDLSLPAASLPELRSAGAVPQDAASAGESPGG